MHNLKALVYFKVNKLKIKSFKIYLKLLVCFEIIYWLKDFINFVIYTNSLKIQNINKKLFVKFLTLKRVFSDVR